MVGPCLGARKQGIRECRRERTISPLLLPRFGLPVSILTLAHRLLAILIAKCGAERLLPDRRFA